MFDGAEKRDYVRVATELNLEFYLPDSKTGKKYPGKTRNISVGGMCAEITGEKEWLDKLIPKKSSIFLNLFLPDTAVPNLECIVDWKQKGTEKSSDSLIGISFVRLGEDDRDKIHAFIVSEFIKSYGKENSKAILY